MSESLPVPQELIERRIYLIRGLKVMLDTDLATLYQVETRVLNQAVRRNLERFPDDFMFQLTFEEAAGLRSQTVIIELEGEDADPPKSSRGRHSKYAPFAFTEHGVAMLSSVLASKRAVQMNILIVRAFVKLRELLASHHDLAQRLEKLEGVQRQQGTVLTVVIDEIRRLKQPPAAPDVPKRRIGFTASGQTPSTRAAAS